MNWKPISEKPKKDGWYLGWCPGASVDNWDPVRWFEGRWLDDTCLTHWAEITGPEEEFCEWEELDACWLKSKHHESVQVELKENIRGDKFFCPHCGRKIKEVK